MLRLIQKIQVNSARICFLTIFLGVSNNFGQSANTFEKKQASAKNVIASNKNQPQAKRYKIKQQIFPYKIGDKIIEIVVRKTTPGFYGLVYFNMHDDENTAVEATEKILEKFGGTFVELRSVGERLIKFSLEKNRFSLDPNRIYTSAGIKKTLKSDSANCGKAEIEAKKLAAKLEGFLKNARLVVAVHNNTDEKYSIESYAARGEFEKDAKLTNIDAIADIDDFFYVTENKFFKSLKGKSQNVVLQDNETVTDDGSLAVYCARNKIPYINVESQHGHLSEQTKMLEILQNLIKDFVRPKKKILRGRIIAK